MRKNITIVILAITLILSIIYGQYEKTEAVKQERLAFENAKLAREAAIKADEQMKLAVEQTQIANEALQKCKKTK